MIWIIILFDVCSLCYLFWLKLLRFELVTKWLLALLIWYKSIVNKNFWLIVIVSYESRVLEITEKQLILPALGQNNKVIVVGSSGVTPRLGVPDQNISWSLTFNIYFLSQGPRIHLVSRIMGLLTPWGPWPAASLA